MAIQVNKLKKLNHVLDEEYQITHILASLPREYSSVVEQIKIDRRTESTLITMDEIKKRLYLQLKRKHGWSEDEMTLNMKSSINQSKNIKKGNKGRFFKGRCNHYGKYGHKKADCWDLKSKQESGQENERKGQKDKSKVRCFKCKKLGHYANKCKNDKETSGNENTFAMMCCENSEEEKYENGEEENEQESKNPDDDERKVDPGTARNTEEPQGIPLTQLYVSNVFMTGITSEWVMSTIEDNLATLRF